MSDDRSIYMTYGGDDDGSEYNGGAGEYDCTIRNVVIIVAVILIFYHYYYKPNSYTQYYDYAWAPVPGEKEMMYSLPYHSEPGDEYTTPYSGIDGYGQNFGPNGPPNV